jgi:hypothetical protein
VSVQTWLEGDRVRHRDESGEASHGLNDACDKCLPPFNGGWLPTAPLARDVNWHDVKIVSTSPNGDTRQYASSGPDEWVAASLRALADQLCPPKPPTPALRPAVRAPEAAPQPSRPGAVALPPPTDVPRGRRWGNGPMSTD